ncbi:hypothetical protein [Culturomica massiliensis]|mgnify:FL=1|jgi:D-alanine-D-alanine ligase|uniref:hypothetical protein n=1 Tax=Culturomica massiliensis TaxID=1841857 RepID=UPI000837FE67|nr:hypothetical protein [Culturomica massiliensis]
MDDLRLVLIADRLYTDNVDVSFSSSSLEQISDEYFNNVFEALKTLSSQVVHYNSPDEFINNIQKHKKDLVFTIYGGERSRNRMALIPAICESYRIKYCGADTYARIICQDKYLSKLYCNDFGLKSAKGYLIRDINEVQLLDNLDFPIVLKPNMEGSSIGITENSLVSNIHEANILIRDLLKVHKQPILAEEFIGGKEVCFYIIGDNTGLKLFSALELYFEDDEYYMQKHLYCANLKHLSEKLRYRTILDNISLSEIEKIKAIFISLGKMDYMRIDCRIKNDELYLIELTPDAHIGADSGFGYLASRFDMSYSDLFKSIINTALNYYRPQDSNLR